MLNEISPFLKEIKQVPRQNNNVVDVEPENNHQRCPADALETGRQSPCLNAATWHELAHANLEQENRDTAANEKDQVRDQKGTAAILVAQVWETPHIAQANEATGNGQDKLALLWPLNALDRNLQISVSFRRMRHEFDPT